jgi:hypothetical protein
MWRTTLIIIVLSLILGGCNSALNQKGGQMYKTHQVQRAKEPPALNGKWDECVWKDVKTLEIKNFKGPKVLYDDSYIYVFFRVEDKYVQAVARNYHDSVWLDSCVEFFFTPGTDISQGYFNIEINCGGTMLFYHQLARGVDAVAVADSDCDRVEIFHSEPKIVDPEKQEPTTWVIEYRVPLDMLAKYAEVVRPAPGVQWRANFQKCAGKTSHPHGLTWSLIDTPKPDFHRPEFFGTLEFK